MLQKFQQHIKEYFPDVKNRKCLLAISGGIDSVVLADLCHQSGMDVAWAHCNFNLRGSESDADEDFVRQLANHYGVTFYKTSFQTEKYARAHKQSIQVAARNLRYQWFKELLKLYDIKYLFTAHHANDNLETFMINLLRGTGLKGLTGIPQQTQDTMRPLLLFSREEIKNYAVQQGLKWREDSSNASEKYLRNKIRHQIIPVLEEENPQLIRRFMLTQQHLRTSENLVNDYITSIYKSIVKEISGQKEIDLEKLLEIPHYQAVLYEILSPYGFTSWQDVYHLVQAESGKQVFSGTHRLLKHRNFLILAEISNPYSFAIEIHKEDTEVFFPLGKLSFCTVQQPEEFTPNTAYLDGTKIKFPVQLRRWEEGDRFCPMGMKGTKKISDFLKDEKCSLIEKENTWVLCSGKEIIWVIGHRIDENYKLKSTTTQILKITFTS